MLLELPREGGGGSDPDLKKRVPEKGLPPQVTRAGVAVGRGVGRNRRLESIPEAGKNQGAYWYTACLSAKC